MKDLNRIKELISINKRCTIEALNSAVDNIKDNASPRSNANLLISQAQSYRRELDTLMAEKDVVLRLRKHRKRHHQEQ